MKKLITNLFFIILSLTLFSSCSKEEISSGKITGTWTYVESEYVFNGESTTMVSPSCEGITVKIGRHNVTQYVTGNLDISVPYTLQGNKMILFELVMRIVEVTNQNLYLCEEKEKIDIKPEDVILDPVAEYMGQNIYLLRKGYDYAFLKDGVYCPCYMDEDNHEIFYEEMIDKYKKVHSR